MPSISLSARPGETVGPRYGALPDTLRFPAGVPEGLYRLTKQVRRATWYYQAQLQRAFRT